MPLGLFLVGEGAGASLKAKADKNIENPSGTEKKGFTQPVITHLHIKLTTGNLFSRLSKMNNALTPDLA